MLRENYVLTFVMLKLSYINKYYEAEVICLLLETLSMTAKKIQTICLVKKD